MPSELELAASTRPRTRGECVGGPRPCPWRSCVHHLGENPAGATCVLDVADEGDHTLDQVGAVLGVTRERVRQIEIRALGRIRRLAVLRELDGGTPMNGMTHRPSLEVEKGEAMAPPPAADPSVPPREGTANPPGAPAAAPTTEALVAALEAAREAVEARAAAVRAELGVLEAALRASAPAEPQGSTRVRRVQEYLCAHPGATAREIAGALGDRPSRVATALCALRRGGRAQSAGKPPALTWTAVR